MSSEWHRKRFFGCKSLRLLLCIVLHSTNIIIMSTEGASGIASGGQLEVKVDLSEETTAKLVQSQALVQAGQLKEALALLTALEKRCRVGNDTPSLVKVCQASLEYCHQVGDTEALLSTLQTLATRRSQKTQAVKTLVHTATPWCMLEPHFPIAVDTPEQKTARDQLVTALRDITVGKLFLEGEQARLTRALAIIKVSVVLL
jgi:26S proteasome regulatory subunit N5